MADDIEKSLSDGVLDRCYMCKSTVYATDNHNKDCDILITCRNIYCSNHMMVKGTSLDAMIKWNLEQRKHEHKI